MRVRTGWSCLSFALFALAIVLCQPQSGHAALTVRITEGATVITISDNFAGDLNTAVGEVSVDVSGFVNPFLTRFSFVSLGASSNGSGVGPPDPIGPAVLTQEGTVIRKAGSGTTLQSITVEVSDNNYKLPFGNPKRMESSGSTTYTSAGTGDARFYRSEFDPSNTLFGAMLATPGFSHAAVGPGLNGSTQSYDTDESMLVLGTHPVPFSLTNISVITAGRSTSVVQRRIQFQGGTTVIGAVPEPATVLSALVGVVCLAIPSVRRLRGRKRS